MNFYDRLWGILSWITKRFFLIAIAISLLCVSNVQAVVTIQFDYTYDEASANFFADGSEARATLEWVGEYYSSLLNDDLTAIISNPEGPYPDNFNINFSRPDTGATEIINDYSVAANTLVVFVGARDLSGNALGKGGFGGASIISYDTTWFNNANTRGQGAIADVEGPSATEASIWGGSISIDTETDWNFDHTALPQDYDYTPETLEYDLASTLLHEMCHVLGFSSLDSWNNRVDATNHDFEGPLSVALYGGDVPLETDHLHWASGTTSTVWGTDVSQVGIMVPSIYNNEKRWTTTLDLAALDDIGWDINQVHTWTAPEGGIFSFTFNWLSNSVPGERDSVLFDHPGPQFITFIEAAQVQQVTLEQGNVTFSLGAGSLDTNLLWVTGSGTSLNVMGGKMQIDVYAMVESGCTLSVSSGGELELAGATLDGDLMVNAGGTLLGDGVITGDLYHNITSTVAPGESGQAGQLWIEGSYMQAADAVLEIDLFSLIDFDVMIVDGNAFLAGDLVVSVDPGLTLSASDEFVILDAGNVGGQFTSVSGDLSFGNLTLEIVYDELNEMVLLVATADNIPGDANGDGKVDGSDVTILADNWQAGVSSGSATWAMGDFNGDGKVDGSDVTILADNWQAGVSSAAATVPEPSAVVMLTFLLLGTLAFRRKRK